MKLDGNMNVMSRSNTWPVVVVRLDSDGHGGGVHVIENVGPSNNGPCTAVTDDLLCVVDARVGGRTDTGHTCPLVPLSARKRATLQRHYYPEGDWGWVIAATAVVVHLLNHGFQLSAAITLGFAAEKHGQTVVNTGERLSLFL